MSLSLSSPVSLYSIPVVWFVGFYPAVLKIVLLRKAGGFDNIEPRGNVVRLAQEEVALETATKAARLEASHMNGNETFPLWSIAILAGNFAKIDHLTLNTLALSFIGSRILYNMIYVHQKTRLHGAARTLIWLAGIYIALNILIKSANIVQLGQ